MLLVVLVVPVSGAVVPFWGLPDVVEQAAMPNAAIPNAAIFTTVIAVFAERIGSGRGVAFSGLLDERDHVRNALRTVRAQMLAQFEWRQGFGDVELRDFRGRLVLHC